MGELIETYGAKLKELLHDPIFFINEIIGFDMEPWKLTPFQEEWLNLLTKHDRLNLMAFRSSGKTESLLVDYPIFKAFTQSGWQGIVVSSSLPQSVEVLKRVRDKILSREILRTSVPDSKSANWSKTDLELKNNSRILSKACNPNLRGYHVDWVGGDEIGEWKDMDIITKTIPPMVRAKNGKIVFIGTPTSHIDPIHELQKNPAYISKAYPANLKYEDKLLWDLRYPSTSIKSARREYDSLSWSREFLCKPLSDEDKIFPFSLIEPGLDYNKSLALKREEHHTYYFGLDFALSAEAQSDYSVFIVLENKPGQDEVRLVTLERYKGLSYQAQKMRIKQLADIFKPTRVVADEGSFGKSFVQDLVAEHIPIQGFKFTQQSKQDLISNLRNFFEKKKLLINYNRQDTTTLNRIKSLLKELDSFGIKYNPHTKTIKFEALGGHDDMTMALCLSTWAARGAGQVTWKVARNNTPKSSIIFQGTV